MTHDELYEVAKRRGKVRWTKSGIIERIRLPRKPRAGRKGYVILALQKHRRIKALFGGEGRMYDCVEVRGAASLPRASSAPRRGPPPTEIIRRATRH